MGASPMRFWKVTLRTVNGVKSLGIGFPLFCGLRAVPAAGNWAGVKYGMPFAAGVGMSGQAIVMSVLKWFGGGDVLARDYDRPQSIWEELFISLYRPSWLTNVLVNISTVIVCALK